MRSFPKMNARRVEQIELGHLLMLEEEDRISFALRTSFKIDGIDEPGVLLLGSEEGDNRLKYAHNQHAIDLGDDWMADMSEHLDSAVISENLQASSLGTMLIDTDGPVAIVTRRQEGSAFYNLKSGLIEQRRPSFRAAVTKWDILIGDKEPKRLLTVGQLLVTVRTA